MDKFGGASAIKARFIAFGLHKFSENRIFTDADDYSMEIELPLADCPQNLDIFGMITRKDVDTGDIFFDALLKKVKPLKSEKPTREASFWKRDPAWVTGRIEPERNIQLLIAIHMQIDVDVLFPSKGCGILPHQAASKRSF
ncbi:MAG: hypothetical protein IJV11_02090 [Muribaculaceae bacterium]|nr:hypothetical protein [Muribaculaceae bacterium]